MSNKDILLTPSPKEITQLAGGYKLPVEGYILLKGDAPQLMPAAERIKRVSKRDWRITAGELANAKDNVVTIVCDPKADTGAEGYELNVTSTGIAIIAATAAGAFYGACTVCQLLKQFHDEIPHLAIRDWPDFPVRGVMLDVTRDKVPTLETLMSLTDMLAEWKINHVELYLEHAYEYRNHPVVWKDTTPITGEDVLRYDKFCAERFIELVPNQNSFGHMIKWIKHDEYRHLSEAPDGCDTVWGHYDYGMSLCPLDPGSIKLVGSLYDELLPHFTSKKLNVGLDETIDLGLGRSKEECEKLGTGKVYLDFLLKIYNEVKKRDHTMLFWGDIMIHHPELIDELPKDTIALEWGYEAKHPFEEDGKKFKAAGIPFWVCPGTSSWNSGAGDTNKCLQNLTNAATNGHKLGATGFLNTDWGDNGHWQYLPVSYLGFMAGAATSWNVENPGLDNIAAGLDLFAFQDSAGVMGGIAYDLGNTSTKVAKYVHNATVIWQCLRYPIEESWVIDDVKLEEIDAAQAVAEKAIADIARTSMSIPDAELVKAEYINNARMLIVGCERARIRFELKEGKDTSARKAATYKMLSEVITEHKKLWLARNKPGGLDDSVSKLEDRLKEMEN